MARIKKCGGVCNVPKYCYCKYIEGGYRDTNSHWSDCVKSVFQVNNETLNFWTHFIPLLMMVKRFHTFVSVTSEPANYINYPFYLHIFSVCYVLSASCTAHVFCACSKFTHKVCFTWDHVCIVLYGSAFQVALETYACPVKCFGIAEGLSREPYLKFSLIFATLQIILICISNGPKSTPRKRFLIRDIPFFIGFLILNFPCFNRYLSDKQYDESCFAVDDSNRSLYFHGFLWILVGIIIFATKFPEVLKPGYFDFFGHSHQLFHICVAVGMYLQNCYIEVSLRKRKVEVKAGLKTNLDLTENDIYGNVTHFLTLFALGHVLCTSYHFVYLHHKKKRS